ncbi:isocitrate lyase/phosphoenolpyruvate mutase family protein [Chromohalobacter sp. 296-RDG]|uniref:isocitrate lyase/phosphoenolpyruvate mutase family protein n=1 Tax=Chromohalobacter sp. 296-RDG TaxID=2994062 RepID=UPI00246941C0|nr:isocitrate lyase/phosphoenolpyruvate mutase family protein [Chromohalobacter sp. 296-RDG]
MSFRDLLSMKLAEGDVARVVGTPNALSAVLAEGAGFDAVWASSFEISASRSLPDASVLTMTEYLAAAQDVQKAVNIPVIADVDTGYGGNLNVAHMVREYENAGITAVAIEDKIFPKTNSFYGSKHSLLDIDEFCSKIRVAKNTQRDETFFVVARTEAFINGLGLDVALERCNAYIDAGADAVLVHSKQTSNQEIIDFIGRWEGRAPVIIVPTTYPDWHVDDMAKLGIATVIYANQGLRATVSALSDTYSRILEEGKTTAIEDKIVPVQRIFELQHLKEWKQLEQT